MSKSLNTNFDTVAELNDDELKVTGTTGPPLDGWQLLTRNIIVMQGEATVQRAATKGLSWETSGRIAPDDFVEADALATGTETYFCDLGEPEKPASFVTISWSQVIRIEKR